MIALIFAMLVVVALAGAVVVLVAVPARREGRELLTPRAEEMRASLRRDTAPAAVAEEPAKESASR